MKQSVTLGTKQVKTGDSVYAYYVLRWYDPATGKRKSETLGSPDRRNKHYITLTEAKKRRDMKAMGFHRSPARRQGGVGLLDWIDQYRDQRKSEGISDRTIDLFDFAAAMLTRHFRSDIDIRSITRADARNFWVAAQEGKLWGDRNKKRPIGKSRQTAAKYLRQIQTLFNRAVEDDMVDANHFTRLAKVRQDSSDWSYVTLDDFWATHKAAPAAWKNMLVMARLAALTREDILRLTWGQVDWEAKAIRIRRAKTNVDQHVPIDQTLLATLEGWRTEHTKNGVIPGPRSKVISDPPYLGNIGRDLAVWCKHAGITPWAKPLHDLRKSCILDWVRLQPSPQVLKLWAGHATITTTLTFYDRARDVDMAVGQGLVFKAAATAK